MNVQTEWVDFTLIDLSFDEETTFTQEYFENMVDDKFVAVEIDGEGKPKYIWTEKFAFIVTKYTKILIGDPVVVGVPRNPDWRTVTSHINMKRG